MEYVNFERLEEIKYFLKFFLFFLTVPAVAWWCGLVIRLCTPKDDEDNCCPHCHIHIDDEPDPQPTHVTKPDPMPPSGGMAIPPMKIPSREREYDYLDRK